MGLPPAMAAKAAITQQNVALSVIKQNADQAQAVAKILNQSVRSAPLNNARGTNVNTSA